MCFDSTRNLAIFKVKILENQKILEETDKEEIVENEDFSQEVPETATPKSKIAPKLCELDYKIEHQSDEEAKVSVKIDFYEEYLEEELEKESFDNSISRKYRESIDQFKSFEKASFDGISVKRKVEKKRLCAGESTKI